MTTPSQSPGRKRKSTASTSESPTKGGTRTFSKTASDRSAANHAPLAISNLAALRIYILRNTPLPPELAILVETIKVRPRERSPSPNGKEVAKIAPKTRLYNEQTAISDLHPILLQLPNVSHMVHRMLDVFFTKDMVPVPNAADNAVLEEVFASLGVPKKPKPDIIYGYSSPLFTEAGTPFSPEETLALRHSKFGNTPHLGLTGMLFPFFTVQWKSTSWNGKVETARAQGARDGSAIVHSLNQFLLTSGIPNFSRENLCHFSATVDSESVILYVHWCRAADGDTESYEMDEIERFWLFKDDQVSEFRRMLYNIFHYALGDRLTFLKRAIGNFMAVGSASEERPTLA